VEPSEAIQTIRTQLAEKQKRQPASTGLTYAEIESLLHWAEKRADDSVAMASIENQRRIAVSQMKYDMLLKGGEAALEAGKTAATSLILINGGAAVAMLSFLGAAKSASAPLMALPLLDFGVGVGVGTLALGFRYFAQTLYSMAHQDSVWKKGPRRRFGWWADRLNFTSIALGVSSLVAFGFGVGNAYLAF
jgi:hypothetical protein